MARRVRKGDLVVVMSGDDRGKRGRVLKVIRDKDRVIVEGVNLAFKHLRRSQRNPQGGRIRREAPIHVSNVMPVDPETSQPTRVAIRVAEGGRVRVGRRSGAVLETGRAAKAAAPKGRTESEG
jgi:large subunit ribosomal protein L24